MHSCIRTLALYIVPCIHMRLHILIDFQTLQDFRTLIGSLCEAFALAWYLATLKQRQLVSVFWSKICRKHEKRAAFTKYKYLNWIMKVGWNWKLVQIKSSETENQVEALVWGIRSYRVQVGSWKSTVCVDFTSLVLWRNGALFQPIWLLHKCICCWMADVMFILYVAGTRKPATRTGISLATCRP